MLVLCIFRQIILSLSRLWTNSFMVPFLWRFFFHNNLLETLEKLKCRKHFFLKVLEIFFACGSFTFILFTIRVMFYSFGKLWCFFLIIFILNWKSFFRFIFYLFRSEFYLFPNLFYDFITKSCCEILSLADFVFVFLSSVFLEIDKIPLCDACLDHILALCHISIFLSKVKFYTYLLSLLFQCGIFLIYNNVSLFSLL